MKKKLCLTALLILTLTLTGCGVTLSDEQNRIIAEYAADLLLKYDMNYQSQYVESSLNTMESEIETTEATTTEAITEENTTEEKPGTLDQDVSSETTTESAGTVSAGGLNNIADLIGMSGASIRYDSYSVTDYYPSYDQEGAFIYLEADEGYKLLVVRFNLENQTSQDMEIDLLNEEIAYKLLLNGTKAAKPMLTILMDDLGTYRSTLSAGGTDSAVLIFQISNNLANDIETLDLQVSQQGNTGTIHIK